jgi:hypothetical protein
MTRQLWQRWLRWYRVDGGSRRWREMIVHLRRHSLIYWFETLLIWWQCRGCVPRRKR